jgi:hypothetical protein
MDTSDGFRVIESVSELDAALTAVDAVVGDLADHRRRLLVPARARRRAIWCDLHDYDDRVHAGGSLRRCLERATRAAASCARSRDLAAASGTGDGGPISSAR